LGTPKSQLNINNKKTWIKQKNYCAAQMFTNKSFAGLICGEAPPWDEAMQEQQPSPQERGFTGGAYRLFTMEHTTGAEHTGASERLCMLNIRLTKVICDFSENNNKIKKQKNMEVKIGKLLPDGRVRHKTQPIALR
jgi:hypothetical protein